MVGVDLYRVITICIGTGETLTDNVSELCVVGDLPLHPYSLSSGAWLLFETGFEAYACPQNNPCLQRVSAGDAVLVTERKWRVLMSARIAQKT
jgi:hypothetical protein